MPRKPRVPSYRLHKPSGLAVVRLNGRDFYLGKHGTAESRSEYERILAEWLASGRWVTAKAPDLSVAEVIAAYWHFAQTHYRKPDGTPTTEIRDLRLSLRPLRQLYGDTVASEFGPLALKAVRQSMVGAGLSRKVTNQRIGRVKRLFKWAVENELLPPAVDQALRTVSGLRQGRTDAHETQPVRQGDCTSTLC